MTHKEANQRHHYLNNGAVENATAIFLVCYLLSQIVPTYIQVIGSQLVYGTVRY